MEVAEFVHQLRWSDLPANVQHQAQRCLLDTVAAAIGGRGTELSRIIHDFCASVYAGQGAKLWFDGRTVSPPGAALANGMTIDALDIHDGFTLTKGHAGAALVPAALATATMDQGHEITGKALLTTLVVGYEVALRAGLALHATACDYHTSGAWNALGCAAVTARQLRLNEAQTRHALGIAEYHGPRSQMMRCIDHPTMVKDGSGWGAMSGVSAALLARDGFSGAPALTVESPEAGDHWSDLGERWLINEQYFKPFAVCRWAQPAITGALKLQKEKAIDPRAIRTIQVTTFHEAVRLDKARPVNTEEAQYSLPFPVAAALVHGRLGPLELSGRGLADPLVLRCAERVQLVEDLSYNVRFPAERLARVQIRTADGMVYDSGPVEATWGAADPPADEALKEKFRWLASTCLSEDRAKALEETIWQVADLADVGVLAQLLAAAVNKDER